MQGKHMWLLLRLLLRLLPFTFQPFVYNFAQNILDIMSHLRDVLAIYDRTPYTAHQHTRLEGFAWDLKTSSRKC